ncbi:MAG: DUF2272 domain-containing protein [Alphaproteobacteria bacterium]|nr:DUF2272 domain-containing protein [Alphaproteobacteria bacterium]MDD9919972.1 DUF2272 domain-containing protein [Alphaproteobacteria bacterium]
MNKLLVIFLLLPFVLNAEEEALPRTRVVATYIKQADNTHKREVKIRKSGSVCTPQKADATLRQRLVNTAASQWEAFGFQIYDVSSRLPSFFPGGNTFHIVPPRKNPTFIGVQERMLRLGTKEDERVTDDYIGSYWATTPQGEFFTNRQNQIWAVASNAGWVDAWSAAFISWVMCEAGLTQEQFKRSSLHWEYVDHAITQSGQQNAIYKAVDYRDAGVPQPGDLICADRKKEETYTHLKDRELGTQRPMHCDLVVQRDWAHNRVFAIGGNVGDSVTLTAARITKTGGKFHLERTPYRPWFVVLKLQTSGTAKLENAPLKIWQ